MELQLHAGWYYGHNEAQPCRRLEPVGVSMQMNDICLETERRLQNIMLFPGSCLIGRLLQVQGENKRVMEIGRHQRARPQIACL